VSVILQAFRILVVEKVPSNNWQQACVTLPKICFAVIMQVPVVAWAVLQQHRSSTRSPPRAAAPFGAREPRRVPDHSTSTTNEHMIPCASSGSTSMTNFWYQKKLL